MVGGHYMQYTEILLKIPSFAVSDTDQDLINSSYVITVLAPRSNRPGPEIFLPEKLVLRVSTNEELRFKLAPSDLYFPLGRYQVEYYKVGNNTPIHKELWLVPQRKGTRNYTWQVSGLGEQVAMPNDYFSAAQVNWSGTFEIVNNRLTWLANHPPVGQSVTLSYTAAATLDDLIELPNTNPGMIKTMY